MKIFYKLVLLFFTSMFIGTSCNESDDFIFARENDVITMDYTEQSLDQLIICNGEWHADVSGVDWITVSPESGTGNGVDYDYYTLNVEYNNGSAREGTINLVHEGQSFPITVNQSENRFAYGTPIFEGNISLQSESTAKILIPYSGASGEESVHISCVMSGLSAGLSIPATTYNSFSTVDDVIEISVEGEAETMGDVMFEIFIDGISVGTATTTIVE